MTTEQNEPKGQTEEDIPKKQQLSWTYLRRFVKDWAILSLSLVPLTVIAYMAGLGGWIIVIVIIGGLVPFLVEHWLNRSRIKTADAYIDTLWERINIVTESRTELIEIVNEYLDTSEAGQQTIEQQIDQLFDQLPTEAKITNLTLRSEIEKQKNLGAGRPREVNLEPELLDRIQAMLDARQTSLRKEAERQHTSRQTLGRRLEERKKEKEGGP